MTEQLSFDGGTGDQVGRGSDPAPRSTVVAQPTHHSPACALCGLKARMWSGVEDWLIDGKWIGWCSNEHRRRWLRGDKGVSSQTTMTEGQR